MLIIWALLKAEYNFCVIPVRARVKQINNFMQSGVDAFEGMKSSYWIPVLKRERSSEQEHLLDQ